MPAPHPPHHAPLLARCGRRLVQSPWRVVAAWLLLIALALPAALTLPGRLRAENDGVPGSESARVRAAIAQDFVDAPGEPWIVVWHGQASDLATDPAVAAAAARLRALPGVTRVAAPTDAEADPRLAAPDGRGGCLLVTPSAHTAAQVLAVREAVRPLREALRARDASAQVATTGAFPLGNDLIAATGTDSTRAERILLGPVLVLLLVVFASPVAAALPLLLAGAASVLAFAVGAGVATLTDLNAFFGTVVSMLGLALGIDYALLITARFRERRRAGDDAETAAVTTLMTAGRTVACAGGVVVVSLAALLPLGLIDARSVGLGGMLVVTAAVALALTLLPAVLVLAAPALDWPRQAPRPPRAGGTWRAWGGVLARFRLLAAPVALVALVVLASPLMALRSGVPDMKFYPPELDSVQGIAALGAMGRTAWTDPVQLVVTRPDGGPIMGPGGLGPLLALSRAIHADPRVAEVLSPVDLGRGLSPTHYALLWARPAATLRDRPALRAFVSRDGRAALFQVIATNDADVSGAIALTRTIRAWRPPGLAIEVGGLAALNLDYDVRLSAALPGAVGGLLAATALILGLVFRSVLVPLKAIALNLLVVAAAIGSLVWVFQLGHGASWLGLPQGLGSLPMLIPMLVFCLTFGLSMDYEVFMIGRVREERPTSASEHDAIARGLAATGGVIVAAAGIMVLVCGAFVGAHMIFVKLFGAGMAIAILLDMTVVRLVLAPTLLAIAGRWNWWPGPHLPAAPWTGEAGGPLQALPGEEHSRT